MPPNKEDRVDGLEKGRMRLILVSLLELVVRELARVPLKSFGIQGFLSVNQMHEGIRTLFADIGLGRGRALGAHHA